MSETLVKRAELTGHSGRVTCLATSADPTILLSGSRDKTVIVWQIEGSGDGSYGYAKRALKGHSHFVSDVTISSDGQFALSGSWDGTLRLFNIAKGTTHKTFTGHSKDVLSVAISADQRKVVSGGRDNSVKLWNILGENKFSFDGEYGHTSWVSSVRFSPGDRNPTIVSAGWDKVVKVWDLTNMRLKSNLVGHTGYLESVCISPDGSLCASGGKDMVCMLWDLKDGRHLYSLDADAIVHCLAFSPNRYWLCAATEAGVRIWDLESKELVAELNEEWPVMGKKAMTPYPTCLAWSADGSVLYVGYTDNKVRVWTVQ